MPGKYCLTCCRVQIAAIMKLRLLFLFLLFVYGSAKAGNPNTIRYIGIEHGLSNNAVTCIHQDHNGFMWFGTYDGLNRYDGYSFKIFRNIIGDNTSLNDNHIFSIQENTDHTIWIGSVKGISIYNPTRSDFHVPLFREWNKSVLQPIQGGVPMIKP